MLRKAILAAALTSLMASCATPTQTSDAQKSYFSKRPNVPRIKPVDPKNPDLTQAQKDLLAGRPDYNLYKTLAHHPDLYNSWSPMGRFILNGSTLKPRDREIVMLRMGWLCQAEYEWAQHARIARDQVGFTDEEIRAVAIGADAGNWSLTEQTLIHMVDELRYDTEISNETWQILKGNFNDKEIMELVYTAGQYQLVSMILNSAGIHLDPVLDHRLPADLPLPALAERAAPPEHAGSRLSLPTLDSMTAEQKDALTGRIRDGKVANLFAMLARNPDLMKSHLGFLSFLNSKSSLTDRQRELAILRTAVLAGIEYEWSYHSQSALRAGLTTDEISNVLDGSDAGNWSDQDAAILRAAEDLRREAFITDDTWTELSAFLSEKQIFELTFLIGGYTLTGLTINAFGIPLDDGRTGFPS